MKLSSFDLAPLRDLEASLFLICHSVNDFAMTNEGIR